MLQIGSQLKAAFMQKVDFICISFFILKDSIEQNKSRNLEIKRDCKDYSGLQFRNLIY